MTQQRAYRLVFAILFLSHLPICPASETPDPTDPNRYLNAVRTFADNVLKYGRDTDLEQEIAYEALWKEIS
jgi:hypothetical protein